MCVCVYACACESVCAFVRACVIVCIYIYEQRTQRAQLAEREAAVECAHRVRAEDVC